MDNQVIGTGKRSIKTTIVAYATMALSLYMAYAASPALWGTIGNGKGASDGVKIGIIIALYIFCGLFFLLGYYLLRMSPTITYYNDGFVVGKGEKVSYADLVYILTHGTRVNTFSAVFYRVSEKMKSLAATAYASNAFHLLQDKVVEANFSPLFDKIEKGETVTFRAMKPGIGKTIKQFDEKADITIRVSKNALAINDEVYPWADYAISSQLVGQIVVADLATNKNIVNFNTKYVVEKPNVLTALIKTIGGR